jgi:hypothetical protein
MFAQKRGPLGALSDLSPEKQAYYLKLLEECRRRGPDGSFDFVHPTGVVFRNGYPVFDPWVKTQVRIKLTGNRTRDFRLANEEAGLDKTPDDYTWHHSEDLGLMQLVPTAIHDPVYHWGGVAVHKRLMK